MSLSHRVTEILEKIFDKGSNTVSASVTDKTGRNAFNSIFGEQIIGTRVPTLAAQFMYGIDTRDANDLSSNGGTTAIADAMLVVSSGTNSAGDGLIESSQALRYIPGHEAYAYFTTIFDTPASGNRMEMGLFEEDNGFWVGYKDLEFGFMRLRAGVEHWTPHTDFDNDILASDSDFQFDPTKGNVWKISYGFLGFANITLEVLTEEGKWIKVHSINYPNNNTENHIGNTYLPLRARVINDGNTVNKSVKVGSVTAGVVDGGQVEITGRRFAAILPEVATSTNTVVAAFRNKTTFNSITNYVPALLERVAASTDGAQAVTLALYKGVTLTNTPTWTDVDTANSTLEYSTDATVSFTAQDLLISFELFKTQNYIEEVDKYNFLLYPGEVAAFVVNGNNNVRQSINWNELF